MMAGVSRRSRRGRESGSIPLASKRSFLPSSPLALRSLRMARGSLLPTRYGRIETKIHIIRLGSYFTTDHARKRAIGISVPGAIERIDAADETLLATVRDPDKKSARLLAYDAEPSSSPMNCPLTRKAFNCWARTRRSSGSSPGMETHRRVGSCVPSMVER